MWSRPDALKILKDKNIRRELSTYFEIMLNKRLSRSKTAKIIEVVKSDNINSFWKEHENIRVNFNKMYRNTAFDDFKNLIFHILI